jgi:hypothetical protein
LAEGTLDSIGWKLGNQRVALVTVSNVPSSQFISGYQPIVHATQIDRGQLDNSVQDSERDEISSTIPDGLSLTLKINQNLTQK